MADTFLTRTMAARLVIALAFVTGLATPGCGGTSKADEVTDRVSAESEAKAEEAKSEAESDEAEAQAEGPEGSTTTITTGSGRLYKTIVERETEGELPPEDFRQVSLLTSRVVNHLNDAARHLADEQPDLAREELEEGLSLVSVVRELLPTTVVTTVVQDPTGAEVYRAVDRLQDDRIPLFEGLVAVKVVQPIAEAKQEAAEQQAAMHKGLRLADADLLETSVLVTLPYVERKLKAALRLLDDEPEEALDHLVQAQTEGIGFTVNERDDPLLKAQLALQLAERMVEQERPEAAKANLQLAWNHLEVYRGLADSEEAESLGELADDIGALVENVEVEDAAERIRGLWDRVADLVTQGPRQARTTEPVVSDEAAEASSSEDDEQQRES